MCLYMTLLQGEKLNLYTFIDVKFFSVSLMDLSKSNSWNDILIFKCEKATREYRVESIRGFCKKQLNLTHINIKITGFYNAFVIKFVFAQFSFITTVLQCNRRVIRDKDISFLCIEYHLFHIFPKKNPTDIHVSVSLVKLNVFSSVFLDRYICIKSIKPSEQSQTCSGLFRLFAEN